MAYVQQRDQTVLEHLSLLSTLSLRLAKQMGVQTTDLRVPLTPIMPVALTERDDGIETEQEPLTPDFAEHMLFDNE